MNDISKISLLEESTQINTNMSFLNSNTRKISESGELSEEEEMDFGNVSKPLVYLENKLI
jgi:hypothetical protein